MENVIRKEFLTELLDVLDMMNDKAETHGEFELLYQLVSTLNENIEFTDDLN